MILGVGADLCRIERIRRSVNRFGKAWLDEIFTNSEQLELNAGRQLHAMSAVGFVLKEACSKAMGTGFADGIGRRDFELSFDRQAIRVRLHGGAARRMTQISPLDGYLFQLSCNTDDGWALATAILIRMESQASISGGGP